MAPKSDFLRRYHQWLAQILQGRLEKPPEPKVVYETPVVPSKLMWVCPRGDA